MIDSKTKILSALGATAMFLAGCADTNKGLAPLALRLPAANEIVRAREQSSIQPKEHYYLNEVQVEVQNDEDLVGIMNDLRTKQNVDVKVQDKIANENNFLLQIKSATPVDEVVKLLRQDSRVVLAARNSEIRLKDEDMHPVAIPTTNVSPQEAAPAAAPRRLNNFNTNDPLLPTQWALRNTGQEAPRALAGRARADMQEGDPALTAGSKNVIVGIIDTGIDYFHEDLAVKKTINGVDMVDPEQSNIWVNQAQLEGNKNNDNLGDPKYQISFTGDIYGYNFVKKNGDPMDDAGHGTHVAGTIGALRNNFKGVSGVVGKVSLMALKFLSASGSGSDFEAQQAIYYAIAIKKRYGDKYNIILSNSWGAAGRNSDDGDRHDPLLKAFKKATEAGILVVAAAGNDGESNRYAPHYPANYSKSLKGMITVAATNNMDQLASFSSFGHGLVDVAAPGVLIVSTVPPSIFHTSYAAFSGTSMATPHVSGLSAAVWAANPAMTHLQVRERVLNTVDILPGLAGKVTTSGRINVTRALMNDVNVGVAQAPVTQEVRDQTPSLWLHNAEPYDVLTKLSAKDATSVAVCFKSVELQTYDQIQILGSDYRVVDTIKGSHENTDTNDNAEELCSAPVSGDKLYLRLWSNGSEGLKGYEVDYLKVVKGN